MKEDEKNPNVEENHLRHRREKKIGGQRGGEDEGRPVGSRGDLEKGTSHRDIGGSRTSKKA